jgi:signal transduction histidine kinase
VSILSRNNLAAKPAEEVLIEAGALQSAIFNSANFSSIATDAKGVIQIFNVGAERMLGYAAADVMNKITPADISDPQEVIARAKALSAELYTPITPGFEALVFKASRGIEDIYELTYIRKDGSRFPAVVSVTALRDAQNAIIGYLLIGTDNTARKQAEAALLEAGALQRAIFNSANFSSIATDAKGVIQIFNVGAERMLGYAAAEVMNKITPADISDPQEVIARAKALSVELGTPITPGFEALVFKAARTIEDIYELTYIRKDGSRFPAVVSVTALRDAQDAIIGYLLIGTDNTARKQAEEALLKAGALQSAIFNSANFSSIATDAKGVIQIFNVGAERMLGYAAADVMNKITPADISDPQEVIARAKALSAELYTPITPGFEALVFKASRGIEDIYELTYIRKDGSRFPAVVSVTALRDAQNAIIGYLLIGTDNTARKQAEAALLEAGALQRAIFNSANFSSIATDAKGVIQIFNVGAERMLGYAAAEVMNKITPADISDPQEVIARAKALSVELGTPITPGFEALVFKAARTIEDIYELTYIRKDGSRFPAVVSVTALRDAQDAIIGYLLIGTDNTARKQAIELEYANRMKSEFLANMSHELRTPLNGIIGFTEFLIDEKPGPLRPKQKEYLSDVLNSARHLLQLINDVLDLAKVEAGKMELHPETFPVRKAVEEVTAVIKSIAQKKHIAMGIEVSDGLDAVTLDQHKFKQVLYNLLSNAVKFSDEGGQVDIHARRLDPHRLEVRVRDTGIGIKVEDINRLFTEFEQLDSGTARRFEGTGLGLALTKKIVEFQGGRISVESEPGKGSVFTVVLPVMTGEGQTA